MDFLKDIAKLSDAQIEPIRKMHEYRFVLMGGASGAGKTRVLVAAMAYLNMLCAEAGMPAHRIRTGLASADMSRVISRFVKEVDDVLISPGLGKIYGATKDSPPAFKFDNPAWGEIHFISLWDIKDPRGTEKCGMAIDELTEIPEELFQEINWRVRYFGDDYPLKDTPILCATNADGPYSHWVGEYFVNKTFRTPYGENFAKEYADALYYIPMSLEDNPNRKAAEEYKKVLSSFPEHLRLARLEGKWGVSTDARFPYEPKVVQPFRIPDHWDRWCGIDWGYAQRGLAAVWVAFNPESGDAYVYRVLSSGNKSVIEAAEEIGQLSRKDELISGRRVLYIGDPTILVQREPTKLRKLEYYFSQAGIHIRPGTKSPLDRNTAIEKYMAPKENLAEGGHTAFTSNVYFFEGETEALLVDLKALRYDLRAKNPENLVPHEHTHTVYALGYVLAGAWSSKARVGNDGGDKQWQTLRLAAEAKAIQQAGMPLPRRHREALKRLRRQRPPGTQAY